MGEGFLYPNTVLAPINVVRVDFEVQERVWKELGLAQHMPPQLPVTPHYAASKHSHRRLTAASLPPQRASVPPRAPQFHPALERGESKPLKKSQFVLTRTEGCPGRAGDGAESWGRFPWLWFKIKGEARESKGIGSIIVVRVSVEKAVAKRKTSVAQTSRELCKDGIERACPPQDIDIESEMADNSGLARRVGGISAWQCIAYEHARAAAIRI
ncbi:hypothetical protein B0H17DRAFT_1180102 [Mycena rosella]|uniref:Uncharacterized protein n=1 Tax=Mycena rosella TaxID=1033263 RepID=A0AAD7GGI8_MYCRO|nr:hypothetical protein B0H17DRAFT_1180102 [Mycena rosella]